MDQELMETYLDILREELVPAMGCTEPIAIAYAAALARDTLGAMPERTVLTVSGNIVKNVKSVVVPNTGGRKGMRSAVAAGLCFGKSERELEVISEAGPEELQAMDTWLAAADISICEAQSELPFDLAVELFSGGESAYVHIVSHHTNVVCIRKNGETLLEKPWSAAADSVPENRAELNVEDIVRFADTVEVARLRPILQRQIEYNTAISQEGLTHDWQDPAALLRQFRP